MIKCTYGHILKNRIKEMGYTQQGFADKVGIHVETLKNIIRGRGKYTVEWLEVFSRELDCSYDYLMGYTQTPNRELQTVKDKISLSDQSISILQEISSNIEYINNANRLKTLDALIEDKDFLNYMTMFFFYPDVLDDVEKSFYATFEISSENDRPPFTPKDSFLTISTKLLISIMNNLQS